MMTKAASPRTFFRSSGLAALAGALLAASAGCASGPPPVFEGTRSVGPRLVLLEPIVRLGGAESRLLEEELAQRLERDLRQRLAGDGVALTSAISEPRAEDLARGLVTIIERYRVRNRRVPTGEPITMPSAFEEVNTSGASGVAFAILGRAGVRRGEDEYLPRPPDELVPLPEERDDYRVPQAGGLGVERGIELDFIVVSARDGRVLMHRRVQHPARGEGAIVDALEVLVREVTRGVQP